MLVNSYINLNWRHGMDAFFIWLIVILVFLSIIGSLLWWVFWIGLAIYAATKACQSLDAMLPDLEALLRQAQTVPLHQRPVIQNEITRRMAEANRQMSQLKDLQRQQYEVRVGELYGIAAEAGIDLSSIRS